MAAPPQHQGLGLSAASPGVVSEARCHQGRGEVVDLVHPHRPTVAGRSMAHRRTELILQEGVDDDPGGRSAVHLDADGHREPRVAVYEVGGAVYWVDHPSDAGGSVDPGALLAEYRVVRAGIQDAFHDLLLGPPVDLGDEVGHRGLGPRDVDDPGQATEFRCDGPGYVQGQVAEGGGVGHGAW